MSDPRKIAMSLAVVAATAGTAFAQPTLSKQSIPQNIPAHLRTHIEALYSPDTPQRAAAAQTLGLLGKQSAPAIPYLIGLFADKPEVRTRAVEALGRIGEPAIVPLIDVMKTGSAGQRMSAAQALGRIGRPAVKPLM